MEIYYIVILNILLFIVGFILGILFKYNQYGSVQISSNKRKDTILAQNLNQSVVIDETKVVTKIDTSGLEKKFDNIGDTKQSKDNISSAINKLKQMKG